MNIGITAARGDIVVRMDAHVEYPTNYIAVLVRQLEESGADNVGGVCQTCPASDAPLARAIAVGMSHPLGVGNSYFRIGTTEPRWVDTVPFGCYRRDVFERIGLFDEELVRNQDDELNLRLIRDGGKILLVPDVVSRYYARDSLTKLWRMYFQYGYFKPLVVRKIGRVMTLRQVVPSLFVTSLAVFGIAAFWSVWAMCLFAFLLGSYWLAITAVVLSALPRNGLACSLCLFVVFPTLHFSYGIGFLRGMFQFLLLRRSTIKDAGKVPISR
jgi:GT2 family glycosyltransferase